MTHNLSQMTKYLVSSDRSLGVTVIKLLDSSDLSVWVQCIIWNSTQCLVSPDTSSVTWQFSSLVRRHSSRCRPTHVHCSSLLRQKWRIFLSMWVQWPQFLCPGSFRFWKRSTYWGRPINLLVSGDTKIALHHILSQVSYLASVIKWHRYMSQVTHTVSARH